MTELSEDPADRARRYIASLESALGELSPVQEGRQFKPEDVERIFTETIQRYLQDAHYYLEHSKPTTSLASIAYAEGLLDALTFLGLTKPRSAE